MNRSTYLSALMVVNLSAFAQQTATPAFTFKTLVSPGTNIAGHIFGAGTSIDGVAVNDAAEVAFVAHWTEAGVEHSGVFTSKRLVARDGELIDGKTIGRITPNSLAINTSGEVGFEAIYGDAGQTGIFLDRKFLVALNGAGSAGDFILSDDGKIVLKAGIAATPAQTTASAAGTAPKNSIVPRGIWLKLPLSVARVVLAPNSPIAAADPNVLLQRTPTRPQTNQQQSKVAVGAQPQACPVPKFPIPPEWIGIGAEMTGPIASHVFEDPVTYRTYQSQFFDTMSSPFRIIQFGSDCRALLIVIGDNTMHGRFEMWTPAGLLAVTNGEGFFEFPGFSWKVTPGPLVRTETPLRINHTGQIAVPVKSGSDSCILLATPTGGSR